MPTDKNLEDDDDGFPVENEEDEGQDAGLVNDEGGDETETGQESQDASPEERVSRRDRRIQALAREAREAKEDKARLERELLLERERRQPQPQQPQEESDDAFLARISLLDPEQRMDAKLERSEKRHQRELLMHRLSTADQTDRAAFAAKASVDPKYRRYQQQVEEVLANERRQGRDYPRETVLRFVIGEAVLNNPKKAAQKQQGQDNIRRQQARDGGGRSDVATQRQRPGQGDTLADLERRLEGRFI